MDYKERIRSGPRTGPHTQHAAATDPMTRNIHSLVPTAQPLLASVLLVSGIIIIGGVVSPLR